MVIDFPADLAGSIRDSAAAAFGFQGQKCSAGSRLIIHEKAYDEVVAGVAEKAKAIEIGIPSESNCDMGAVIDAKAQKSILNYIEIGKKEGCVAAQSPVPRLPSVSG